MTTHIKRFHTGERACTVLIKWKNIKDWWTRSGKHIHLLWMNEQSLATLRNTSAQCGWWRCRVFWVVTYVKVVRGVRWVKEDRFKRLPQQQRDTPIPSARRQVDCLLSIHRNETRIKDVARYKSISVFHAYRYIVLFDSRKKRFQIETTSVFIVRYLKC